MPATRAGPCRRPSPARHPRQDVQGRDLGLSSRYRGPTHPSHHVSDGASPNHELSIRRSPARSSRRRREDDTPDRNPQTVRDAAPLIEHVTVGGSRVDTQDEAEAVAVWLEHRIAVTTARNWAAQHDLSPPTADAQLKDWLTAVSRLPEGAAELDKKLTSLLDRCHVPSDAQTWPADVLVQAVVAASAARITSELQEFTARRQQLGSADVRVDGWSRPHPAQDAG